MKKALLSIVLSAFVVAPIFAQDLEVIETVEGGGKLMTKRGAPILPEAGDWGIGISANPFLEYVGNAFNGTANNAAPTWGFTAQYPMTIYGRMVQSDDTYLRGLVRIGFTSASQTSGDPSSVETKVTQTAFSLVLGAGIEKNKSLANRLRGYYGAMAAIAVLPYQSGDTVIGNITTEVTSGGQTQESSTTGGGYFGVAVRGFIGAEYFFAPKMSLGGEFGWGIGILSQGERTSEVSGTSTVVQGSGFRFATDTDNGQMAALSGLTGFNGQLTLFIYF